MKNEIFVKPILLSFVTLLLLASGCDTPSSTEVLEPGKKKQPVADQFFSHSPDSIGPLLSLAIDTLQERDKGTSFIDSFIVNRGVPVWDGYHSFYSQGQRVLRVPVRDADERTITGLIDITIKQQQPTYRWIARDNKLQDSTSKAIETIIWGYEKQVFGKKYTDEGDLIKTKGIPGTKGEEVKGKMQEDPICSQTCVGNYCGPSECEDQGGYSGDDSGFGGSDGDYNGGRYGDDGTGGSSSDDGSDGKSDNEEHCSDQSESSSKVNPGEEDPYEGPSYTPPCEEGEKIISYPEVRYPEDSNYAEQYPKLTEYLKNQLPKIADNKKIVDAILKYADLNREQIKEELLWGEGPTIVIKQLDNYDDCGKCDEDTAGLFDANANSEVLYLDIDAVNLLENTSNQVMGDAFSFWMGTVILHEFVHYGDHADGTDYPGEEGILFEDEAYGEKVTNKNATEILYSR